ncbi:hypothetical protein [Paenibacillus donghaensis]|uniref:hypothetical protein n=1 Tax=Paenibacillus donghaensis TaxID=414771 RepID=UPI0012FD063D|nr:hypothetical protein [Paenibacillus donghaensis]
MRKGSKTERAVSRADDFAGGEAACFAVCAAADLVAGRGKPMVELRKLMLEETT